MIKAVISDLAGTTIDFGSSAPSGAFIELFRRHGIAVSTEQARGPMGLDKRAHIQAIASMSEIREQWRTVHGDDWTETDIDSLYAEFIPLQLQVLPDHGDIIPGVPELVASLKQAQIQLGVTTGYNREMLQLVLRCAAEQGLVPDVACSAEDVSSGRPAPWMIYRCLEQLGVYPSSSVINVGDTLPDVLSGRNAGAWSVGVVQTGNMLGLSRQQLELLAPGELARRSEQARQAFLKSGAHYVIDNITQLPAVIETVKRQLAQGKPP
jgi:phosphonoacetaldehyde hydrolase